MTEEDLPTRSEFSGIASRDTLRFPSSHPQRKALILERAWERLARAGPASDYPLFLGDFLKCWWIVEWQQTPAADLCIKI